MTDPALKELFPRPSERNLPHLDILHYLLLEERGNHVAHCLDLDLVEVAQSRREAAARLDRLVKAHVELALATGELANLQTSAPQAFWKRFLNGQRVNLEPATVRIQIPESV